MTKNTNDNTIEPEDAEVSEQELWHLPFSIATVVELADIRADIEVEREVVLGKEPPRLDVVVIKLKDEVRSSKNFAQIFKKYNVFEFKSPTDSLSMSDFHKALAYAYLYCSHKDIQYDKVTLTTVSYHTPNKIIKFLQVTGCKVDKKEKGLYHVEGHPFPVQLVVAKYLDPKVNPIYQRLRNDLTIDEFTDVVDTIYKVNMADSANELIETLLSSNTKLKGELDMSKEDRIIVTLKNIGVYDRIKRDGKAEVYEEMAKFGFSPEDIAQIRANVEKRELQYAD